MRHGSGIGKVLIMKRLIFIIMVINITTAAYGQSEEEKMNTIFEEGMQLSNQLDFQNAAHKFEGALQIARNIGDNNNIGEILTILASSYSHLYDYKRAISYCEQALEIYREIGGKEYLAVNYYGLGLDYYYLRNFEKAISYFEQSLKILRKIKEKEIKKELIGRNLLYLGHAYKAINNDEDAILYYEKALKFCEELGDKSGIMKAYTGLGDVYWERGDGFSRLRAISYYDNANAYNFYAEDIPATIDVQEALAIKFNSLGNACVTNGNFPAALTYYEVALETFKTIGDRVIGNKHRIANILSNYGVIYYHLGSLSEGALLL